MTATRAEEVRNGDERPRVGLACIRTEPRAAAEVYEDAERLDELVKSALDGAFDRLVVFICIA